jgi:tetratricopeptide (TPR) repeat protein
MIATIALILGLSMAPQAVAPPQDIPAVCRPDVADQMDVQACADAAPKGSPVRALALINLASQAYLAGDYARALGFYDEAVPPGMTVTSDIVFHTFRGDTYFHAGREEAARADADLAWRMLKGEVSASGDPDTPMMIEDGLRFEVLIRILPILKDGDPATFAAAKAQVMALPATDGIALTNRAGLLAKLGDYDAAIADSRAALALAPDEAGVQNNHCFILYQAGRAAEGLPYCEAALATLPNAAPIRHSYALALAATGRCAEAETQIAEARRLDPSSVAYAEPLICTAS